MSGIRKVVEEMRNRVATVAGSYVVIDEISAWADRLESLQCAGNFRTDLRGEQFYGVAMERNEVIKALKAMARDIDDEIRDGDLEPPVTFIEEFLFSSHDLIALKTAIALLSAADGEVVYQWLDGEFLTWTDCSKDEFDLRNLTLYKTRTLYTTPQASVVDEDMVSRAIEAFDDTYEAEYLLNGMVDNKHDSMKAALKAALEQSK
jgi:hypothetical protein